MRQTAIFLGQAVYTDTAITEAVTQANEFIRQLAACIPDARVKCMTQQLAMVPLEKWAYCTIMVVVDVSPHALTMFDTVYKKNSYHVGQLHPISSTM